MPRIRLESTAKAVLEELYRRSGRTADDLPYTEEFDILYGAFLARTGLTMTRHDVWKALASSRKSRRLVRKERPAPPVPATIGPIS